jgi:hypothetical protein
MLGIGYTSVMGGFEKNIHLVVKQTQTLLLGLSRHGP